MNPALMAAVIAATSKVSPSAPPVPALEWVTPPPDTATTGTDYTASWSGGVSPYHAEIRSATDLLNDQDGATTSITMNVDGTNQPVGDYTWTVTDAKGATLTATTTVEAP